MDLTDTETAWLRDELEDDLDRDYLVELSLLQVELLKLQAHVVENRLRLAVIFEGRDTAGKGGAILRFTQHLMPRHLRVVALNKPTQEEAGQWYFQRYVRQLPDPGQIVFFDRSWYNRAVVEPVMGFCTPEQHERFMNQVPAFEEMLLDEGLLLVKLWFSIEFDVQAERLEQRRTNPLKRWKLSAVDAQAQQNWDAVSQAKQAMFERTGTARSPWVVVEGNDKKRARLESIRHVLSVVDYPDRGRDGLRIEADPKVVRAAAPGSS